MSLGWLRLTLRLGRFELIAFSALVLGSVVAAFAMAAWLDSLRPAPECLQTMYQSNEFIVIPPACQEALETWNAARNGLPGFVPALVVFLPLAAGLFLGVPIVARELERGTTRLAWSLSPSRLRWYLARMVPVLAIVAIITFAAGVAADRILASTEPGIDPANSFANFGFRGLLLASRAVFIFALAVLVGAVFARALPSVIIAAVIAAVGLTGGDQVHREILRSEAIAIPVDEQNFNGSGSGHLYFEQKFMLPDGALVGWEYFGNTGPFDENGNPDYPMVSMVVPGERYRYVETREALALAGGSFVALALAAFVVARRRPG